MIITQHLLDTIVDRAANSELGLTVRPNLNINEFDSPNIQDLATELVNKFDDKYDLISLVTAAIDILSAPGV